MGGLVTVRHAGALGTEPDNTGRKKPTVELTSVLGDGYVYVACMCVYGPCFGSNYVDIVHQGGRVEGDNQSRATNVTPGCRYLCRQVA